MCKFIRYRVTSKDKEPLFDALVNREQRAGVILALKIDLPPLTLRDPIKRLGNRPARGYVDPRHSFPSTWTRQALCAAIGHAGCFQHFWLARCEQVRGNEGTNAKDGCAI